MHKQIVWTLFFLLMLLLFINSLGGTSGYINPSLKAPPGWRKLPNVFQPSGSFTQSDRDIILKLSNDQISAIVSLAKAVGLPSQGLLDFLHNLISVNELQLFANQLIEAPDETSAIAVFSRYKKLLSPQTSMPTMAPPVYQKPRPLPQPSMPIEPSIPVMAPPKAAVATSSFMTNINAPPPRVNCNSLNNDLSACRQTPGCVTAFKKLDPEQRTYCFEKDYIGSRLDYFTVAQ